MQCGDVTQILAAAKREVEIVDMKMNDIESGRRLGNALNERNMMGYIVATVGIRAQRSSRTRNQTARCARISACKQSNVVPGSHKFLGKPRNPAFCAAIMQGRDALIQRCNLCDTHNGFYLRGICFTLQSNPSFSSECEFPVGVKRTVNVGICSRLRRPQTYMANDMPVACYTISVWHYNSARQSLSVLSRFRGSAIGSTPAFGAGYPGSSPGPGAILGAPVGRDS